MRGIKSERLSRVKKGVRIFTLNVLFTNPPIQILGLPKITVSTAHIPQNVQINYSASNLTHNVTKYDLLCNKIRYVTRIAIKCRF